MSAPSTSRTLAKGNKTTALFLVTGIHATRTRPGAAGTDVALCLNLASSAWSRHGEQQLRLPCYIVRDQRRSRVIWDILQAILLMYIAGNVPLEIAQFVKVEQIPPGTPGSPLS